MAGVQMSLETCDCSPWMLEKASGLSGWDRWVGNCGLKLVNGNPPQGYKWAEAGSEGTTGKEPELRRECHAWPMPGQSPFSARVSQEKAPWGRKRSLSSCCIPTEPSTAKGEMFARSTSSLTSKAMKSLELRSNHQTSSTEDLSWCDCHIHFCGPFLTSMASCLTVPKLLAHTGTSLTSQGRSSWLGDRRREEGSCTPLLAGWCHLLANGETKQAKEHTFQCAKLFNVQTSETKTFC